jgi:L-2,4-diaminobutyric acid acetyltransferase
VLSVNSSYAYVLMADFFGPSCALAEHNGRAAGAVIGMRRPDRPQALFIWQIGVHPQARGTGLAQRMLDAILARPGNADVRELHATVAPSNGASERMFRRFAARHGAQVELTGGYPAELFPDSREAERAFRIRPLQPGTRPEDDPC